jgi:hypothetical protein
VALIFEETFVAMRKVISRSLLLGGTVALSIATTSILQAQAATLTDFSILYEGHGGNTLSFNNGSVGANIGIGGTGKYQQSSGTVSGNIDFFAGNSSAYQLSGGTNGGALFNIGLVNTDLNYANSLSQSLGLESGKSITVSSGGSITATTGTLDAAGNRVFNVTGVSFPNGTFTIMVPPPTALC